MPNIEAANPENDVFGNVRGVVGDTFQVTRGQDKLQTGTDRLRLASEEARLNATPRVPRSLSWQRWTSDTTGSRACPSSVSTQIRAEVAASAP